MRRNLFLGFVDSLYLPARHLSKQENKIKHEKKNFALMLAECNLVDKKTKHHFDGSTKRLHTILLFFYTCYVLAILVTSIQHDFYTCEN